jgi:hypothetical protein
VRSVWQSTDHMWSMDGLSVKKLSLNFWEIVNMHHTMRDFNEGFPWIILQNGHYHCKSCLFFLRRETEIPQFIPREVLSCMLSQMFLFNPHYCHFVNDKIYKLICTRVGTGKQTCWVLLCFWGRVSQCCSSWPQTHYVDQAQTCNPPASAPNCWDYRHVPSHPAQIWFIYIFLIYFISRIET